MSFLLTSISATAVGCYVLLLISKKVSLIANLVLGIFQGLPVKAPHSPVALIFHPDKQAGTRC